VHRLRLLRTDLSGPQIAREPCVSVSTARGHTQSIYARNRGVDRGRVADAHAAGLRGPSGTDRGVELVLPVWLIVKGFRGNAGVAGRPSAKYIEDQ
jgi:hypothetical protein